MANLFKRNVAVESVTASQRRVNYRHQSNIMQQIAELIFNVIPNIATHSLYTLTAFSSPATFHKLVGHTIEVLAPRIINSQKLAIVYHNPTLLTGSDLVFSRTLSHLLTNRAQQNTSAQGLLSGQNNPQMNANFAPNAILGALINEVSRNADIEKLVYILHVNSEMFQDRNMDLLTFLSTVIRKQRELDRNNIRVLLITDNLPDRYAQHFHTLTIEDSQLRRYALDIFGETHTSITTADGILHANIARYANVFERNIGDRIKKFVRTHFANSGIRVLLPEDINYAEPIGQSNFLQTLQRFAQRATASAHTSWLFFGPPGTGKTYSAQYLARQLDKPLIIFSLSDIKNSLYGQSEANLRNFLRLIEEVQDVILFIDEFGREFAGAGADAITDSGVTQSLTSMFLQWIQSGKPVKTILIAASNEFDHLPDALLRPGRFGVYAKYDFLYKPELPIILDLIKQRLDFWAAKGVKIDDTLYDQAVELANSVPDLPPADIDLQQYIAECRAENRKALTPADIVQIVDNAIIMEQSLLDSKENIMLVFDRVSDRLIETLAQFKGIRVWG